MAKAKSQSADGKVEMLENDVAVSPLQIKLPESSQTKVKFLVWFTQALDRFKGMKAHHMSPLKVYFSGLGVGEPAEPEDYDEAARKFGYGMK